MTLLLLLKPKWHLVGAGDDRKDKGFPAYFDSSPLKSKSKLKEKIEVLEEELEEILGEEERKEPEILLDDAPLRGMLSQLSEIQFDIEKFKIENDKLELSKIKELRKKILLILLIMMTDGHE